MRRARIGTAGTSAALLVLSLGVVSPAVAVDAVGGVGVDAPGPDVVALAAEADARGYIIVYPGDAIASSDAVFLETGPISRDTLVVVAEPDGSLPGGMTEADVAELVAQRRADASQTVTVK